MVSSPPNSQSTAQQHQIQLAPSRSSPHQELYYPPSGGSRSGFSSSDRHRSHRHHSAHSRSRSRRGSSTHRHRDHHDADTSDDSSTKSHRKRRSGSKSGGRKAALGVVAGAGAGGLLGHEILGGGMVGTVSGMLVGAMGAQALERRHERYVVHIFPFNFLRAARFMRSLRFFFNLFPRFSCSFFFWSQGENEAALCLESKGIWTNTHILRTLGTRKPEAHRLEAGGTRAMTTAKKA